MANPQWNPHGTTHYECPELILDYVVVGPFQENSYFVRRPDSDRVILIDPGDEAERLLTLIAENNWVPEAIVNTHAHLDHIGAVCAIQDKYDIPFYLHKDEIEVLKMAPLAARMFGVSPPRIPEVDHFIEADQPLELAGISFGVAFTPGHSPGSVSFLLPGIAIAGDVLFYGSIGRTDLPGGNFETLISSIRRELLSLPNETVVFSGHGPHTSVGREREHNPFLNS